MLNPYGGIGHEATFKNKTAKSRDSFKRCTLKPRKISVASRHFLNLKIAYCSGRKALVSRKPPRLTSPSKGIRNHYQEFGATKFYEKFGAQYRNPHEAVIRVLVERASVEWKFEIKNWRVLDLACGSGEATLALRDLGCNRIDGIDPYTGQAYFERTGQTALPHSFEELAKGVLPPATYDLCICSFALHLASPSFLPPLCLQLALRCARLWILTPHKRPHISSAWGWELKNEMVHERVRARCYQSLLFEG